MEGILTFFRIWLGHLLLRIADSSENQSADSPYKPQGIGAAVLYLYSRLVVLLVITVILVASIKSESAFVVRICNSGRGRLSVVLFIT